MAYVLSNFYGRVIDGRILFGIDADGDFQGTAISVSAEIPMPRPTEITPAFRDRYVDEMVYKLELELRKEAQKVIRENTTGIDKVVTYIKNELEDRYNQVITIRAEPVDDPLL